jgi:N-acetylglutamate synthase-like GNAT family acetyltransferase
MIDEDVQIKQIVYGSQEYKEAVNLRNEILRLPLGHCLNINKLQKEEFDIHIIAMEKEKVIGTLILTPIDDNTIKMRQVAVVNELQGRGVGSKLIKFSEKTAKDLKYSKIILEARSSALDFYLKMGYQIIGNEYIDEHINIPHYKMEKAIV